MIESDVIGFANNFDVFLEIVKIIFNVANFNSMQIINFLNNLKHVLDIIYLISLININFNEITLIKNNATSLINIYLI